MRQTSCTYLDTHVTRAHPHPLTCTFVWQTHLAHLVALLAQVAVVLGAILISKVIPVIVVVEVRLLVTHTAVLVRRRPRTDGERSTRRQRAGAMRVRASCALLVGRRRSSRSRSRATASATPPTAPRCLYKWFPPKRSQYLSANPADGASFLDYYITRKQGAYLLFVIIACRHKQ